LKGDLIPIDNPFMDLPLFGPAEPILIRAEYIRMYNEVQKYYDKMKGNAQKKPTAAVAVLSGQPGIGMGHYCPIVLPLYSFFRKVDLDSIWPLSPTIIVPSSHVVIRWHLVSIHGLGCP
jgi:hypothetical protein